MKQLTEMNCVPCRGESPGVTDEELARFKEQIPDWEIVQMDEEPQLMRIFKFKNFADALDFTNRVGALAETQDHHPAMLTEWGQVTVRWWTHAIHGLHMNDLVSSAKTDEIYVEMHP